MCFFILFMWRNKINALSAAFSFNDSRVLTVHASIPMLVKYGSRTSDLFGRIKKTYSVPWHRIVPTRWIRCRYPHRFEGAWTLNRFSWKWAYLLPLWLLLSNTLQEGGREISPMFILHGPDWVWGHALLMPFSLRNTFVGKLITRPQRGMPCYFKVSKLDIIAQAIENREDMRYLLVDSNLLLTFKPNLSLYSFSFTLRLPNRPCVRSALASSKTCWIFIPPVLCWSLLLLNSSSPVLLSVFNEDCAVGGRNYIRHSCFQKNWLTDLFWEGM